MKSTPKNRPTPRWLVASIPVGVVVVAALWLGSRDRRVEGLVPVVREGRIDLTLRLDDAEQGAGWKAGARHLGVRIDPLRNVDHDGLPFAMPLPGEVVFRDVPRHAGALLRVACGVDQVSAAEAEGARVVFTVHARAAGEGGGEVEVVRAEEVLGPPGAPPTRRTVRGQLPDRGERIDLVFRTACDRTLPELAALPVFCSPVVESAGVKRRVESLAFTRTVVLRDLLADYEAAIEEDAEREHRVSGPATAEHAFAIRRELDGTGAVRESYLGIEYSALTGAFFATEAEFGHAHGGAWPAIAFSADGTLVRYLVDVPQGGAALAFRIAMDHRAHGVGDVEFAVSVDGQRVWGERLDPAQDPSHAGWHDREVDLTPWQGKTVTIGLHGAVARRAPVERELDDYSRPLGPPQRYRLQVLWPRGAFGTPRIVREENVGRRLAARDRPSVVLVNVETWRADATSLPGLRRRMPEADGDLTPALARLAREGLYAEDCIAAAPWTAPSVASTFTGVFPQSHGVVAHERSWLADGALTLAERAQSQGITTAAFSTNDYVGRRHNFDQGFETFLQAQYANARQMVSSFEDWLHDNGDLQFFAYLHLFEPHDPCNAPGEDFDRYVPAHLKGADSRAALARLTARVLAGDPPPPDDDDVRLLRGRYLGEVRYLDRQLERLRASLEARGLTERVVLIVASDHGEEFLEHGLLGHGSSVHVESVAVPLVAWGPGHVQPGGVLRGTAGTPALFATVLDALGVPYERSQVRPALPLDGGAAGEMAYSVTEQGLLRVAPPDIFTRTLHAVRTAEAALLYGPAWPEPAAAPVADGGAEALAPGTLELYLRESDPAETRDVRREQPALLARTKTLLQKAVDWARGIRLSPLALEGTAVQMGYLAGVRADHDEALFPPGEVYEGD